MFGKVRFKDGIFGTEFSEVTLNSHIFIYFIYLLRSKPYRTVIVQNSAFDWLGFVRCTDAERQKGTIGLL